MLQILDNVVFCNDNIDLDDIDSDTVTFFSDDMGLVTIGRNNINLEDDNFDKDDFFNIVLVRIFAWQNIFKQRRAYKKDRLRINAYSMTSNKSVGLVYDKG